MSALRLLPYGPTGLLVDLGLGQDPARAARTKQAVEILRREFAECDVVGGLGSVGIFGWATTPSHERIEALLGGVQTAPEPSRRHLVDVVYDGLDLAAVAGRLRLSSEEVIELHTSRSYEVQALGFLPGFGYLGPLSERLVLPRRESPRPRVAAGSVAIASGYTSIYPFSSPGGWHLLGRYVGPPLFDPTEPDPCLFGLGDQVRFVSVTGDPSPEVTGRVLDIKLSLSGPKCPHLRIDQAPPLATLQDGGRTKSLHRGLPPSGPLDPDAFLAANAAVHNPITSATLEVLGGALKFQSHGRPLISLQGAPPFRPDDGETITLGASEAPQYLAIAGGFDAEVLLGSRSTHVSAGFGGYQGRPLRRGDVLLGSDSADPLSPGHVPKPPPFAPSGTALVTLRISPGPHADLFPPEAWQLLVESTYHVSKARDRTGTRIEGPALPAAHLDIGAPIPILRGAMQVPPNGQPIVLGPDHPITGGYPVIAVVRPESLGALARAHPETPLRFAL